MQISHTNVIKIFGIFEENEKIYIVLEYCENGDFYEFLKNNSNTVIN
jgi:serine/threonine protein kinase